MPFDLRELRRQLHEDWITHDRDWTTPGFRALATHRIGNWIEKKSPGKITAKVLWFVYRALYRYIRNHYGIEVFYSTKIGRRVRFGHQSGIVIHPHAEIGDDCLIRQNVTIGVISHTEGRKAPKLGNRVQIGAGAVIMGKIVIGDDVSIGPNVTVLTNIPAGTIVSPQSPRLINMASSRTQSLGVVTHS